MPSDRVLIRNIIAFVIPEVLWGFAWTTMIDNPMPAAYAKSFCADEWMVGAFALCAAVGLGVPMLFTAWALEPLRRKKGLVFWWHVVPALMVGALAAWVGLTDGRHPELAFLIGFGLFFLSVGFVVPAWMSLIGDLFPDRLRSRLLGFAFAGNKVGGLLGGFLAQRMLASSLPAEEQWTWLFSIGAAALLVGSFPFLLIVEPEGTATPRQPMRSYLRSLRNCWRDLHHFRRFVKIDMLAVTAFALIWFYGDAAMRNHGMHESWAGVWSRVSSGAQLSIALLIGWLGARLSQRRWLQLGSLVMVGGALLATVADQSWQFTCVAAAGGAYLVIRMTCQGPQVFRLTPGRDGAAPIAISWAMTMPVQGLLPFLSSLAIPHIGYAPLFILVAIASLVAVVLLSYCVPDHA